MFQMKIIMDKIINNNTLSNNINKLDNHDKGQHYQD